MCLIVYVLQKGLVPSGDCVKGARMLGTSPHSFNVSPSPRGAPITFLLILFFSFFLLWKISEKWWQNGMRLYVWGGYKDSSSHQKGTFGLSVLIYFWMCFGQADRFFQIWLDPFFSYSCHWHLGLPSWSQLTSRLSVWLILPCDYKF